jgi:hypothetical protein
MERFPWCRPDGHGFVREQHVQRLAIRLGVHRTRLDPHLAQGADDADRDLAAVRDEHLVEHGGLLERRA